MILAVAGIFGEEFAISCENRDVVGKIAEIWLKLSDRDGEGGITWLEQNGCEYVESEYWLVSSGSERWDELAYAFLESSKYQLVHVV